MLVRGPRYLPPSAPVSLALADGLPYLSLATAVSLALVVGPPFCRPTEAGPLALVADPSCLPLAVAVSSELEFGPP
jgi:hypothetical protein